MTSNLEQAYKFTIYTLEQANQLLTRTLAVERGDESQAPSGWKYVKGLYKSWYERTYPSGRYGAVTATFWSLQPTIQAEGKTVHIASGEIKTSMLQGMLTCDEENNRTL